MYAIRKAVRAAYDASRIEVRFRQYILMAAIGLVVHMALVTWTAYATPGRHIPTVAWVELFVWVLFSLWMIFCVRTSSSRARVVTVDCDCPECDGPQVPVTDRDDV